MSFNFTAHPVLLNLGSFTIYSWGLLNAIAILVACFFIYKKAKKHFPEKEIEGLALSAIISAIIFARVAYILINPKEFTSFIDYISIWKGGLEGFGTFIGGILGAYIFSKIKKIDFWAFMDTSAPWLALAYGIGRIGCFLRGCCFGLPTDLPWGVIYSEGSLAASQFTSAVHPTQLYHALADFIIFFLLLWLIKRKQKKVFKINETHGKIFLLFLILYSIERFLIDFLRWHSQNELFALGFSIEQFVYFIMFIVSLLLILKKARKRENFI